MSAIKSFENTIERASNMLAVHRQAFKKGRPPVDWTGDLLRSAVVFAIAALDAYMHEKVVETAMAMLKVKDQNLSQKFVDVLKEEVKYEKLVKLLFRPRADEKI